MCERVHRSIPNFSLAALCNVLAALYSEQEVNFSLTSTHAVDGGVYVIPGRFNAHRTSIIQDKAFLNYYVNEYICWSLIGPMSADEDNLLYAGILLMDGRLGIKIVKVHASRLRWAIKADRRSFYIKTFVGSVQYSVITSLLYSVMAPVGRFPGACTPSIYPA